MAYPLELSSTGPVQATANLQAAETLGNPRLDNDLLLNQIQIGKTYPAQILSMLQDGTALIKLNINPQQSAQLQIAVPTGYVTGDTLYLNLQSLTNGRPRFVLEHPGSNQDQVELSQTGRWLEQVLNNQPESASVHGSRPVSQQAATPAPQLASALSQTVENSGLFYESHLKDWQDGQRSLEQIRQEPQNQTNGPQNALQLLPIQLDTLEHQRFIWQGEIWPGQQMQWEIHPDDPQSQQQSQASAPDEKRWATTLTLDLPHLGKLKAELQLQGDQLGLVIQSRQAETAASLRQAAPQLADLLSSEGTYMKSLVVQQDDGL